MASRGAKLGCLFLALAVAAIAAAAVPSSSTSSYIVHIAHSAMPATFSSHLQWYASALAQAKGQAQVEEAEAAEGEAEEAEAETEEAEEAEAEAATFLYTYSNVFHGFAAELTAEEARALERAEGVLRVAEDGAWAQLHTTRTPQFLGLEPRRGLLRSSEMGEQVIVGVIDSGIWPERGSFGDAGLGAVPAKWKGSCESTRDFAGARLCNRKLIGARSFYKGYESAVGSVNATAEYRSPRDSQGHGTHTSSTAAGAYVRGANLLGAAWGTARGIAPRARIAVYKVCWAGGCFNSDILAAFDQAVADGVDVLSLSVGGGVLPYYLDPIAIGSFGAMEKGILVSSSAGNAGPTPASVANVAPWMLTVGASTLDRDFPAFVRLGNGRSYKGISLYDGKELVDQPFVYAGDAGLPGTNGSASLCTADALDPRRVAGKVVLCDRGVSARAAKGMAVRKAGGAAMVLANAEANGEELIADSHVLPAALVGYKAGVAIKKYLSLSSLSSSSSSGGGSGSGLAATVSLAFSGTVLGVKPSPVMAAFSSRGPNPANPEILKPDVTAPGVNILAAWTDKAGPTELPGDGRVVPFNIMSGTSMSCPHASGAAALLRGARPHWSPAAVKSALMTTAYTRDSSGNALLDGSDASLASTPFAEGSGHVDPARALDPGLVYDLAPQDYVDFLCALNYSAAMLASLTKEKYTCSRSPPAAASDLNYPSFSFVFRQGADGVAAASASSASEGKKRFVSTLTRTVTNVGPPSSAYAVKLEPPSGVTLRAQPSTLSFSRALERKSYTLTCEAGALESLSPGESRSVFGSVTWLNEAHTVRSPVAFTWQN